MEKKEKKDQFIIAYLADIERPETVLSYAAFMSHKLSKGLILLHICDPKYSTLSTEEAESKLQELVANTTTHHSGLQCTYAALKGKTLDIINALPTLMNAVLIVAQVDRGARRHSPLHKRNVLKNFAQCRTAYLTAQEPLHDDSRMLNVATAIDFKKESKDKLIWSSYFPRFCGSTMHILYYDYKDQFLHSKWYANMTQLHKLYSGLSLTFQPHIIESKSTYMDVNALRFASQSDYGMLIAVTTKEKDGLEFFIGVQEQRTIVNKAHIPILFLNPREDLYVLCD
ncbi:MAG: hypothetical protein J6T88_08420 [Bacteroidales bacterium]|nr:hypothetical protein [Bacteroidales bacterium]